MGWSTLPYPENPGSAPASISGNKSDRKKPLMFCRERGPVRW